MARLKACPFCGGKAHLTKMGFPHWVFCEECGARVQGGTCNERDSVAAWNRRVNESPRNKCGDCMYLDLNDKQTIGYPCGRPDHYWVNELSRFKQKSTHACKDYKPREG